MAGGTAAGPRQVPGRLGSDRGIFFRRFDRRFDLLQQWLTIAFPIIFVIVALTQHVTVTMAAIHLGMYLMVAAFRYVTRPRDAMVSFLVTYVFWFYSFALFAYALVHWQSPEDDLYGPWLSSMVAFVGLVGCISGYALHRLVLRLVGSSRPDRIVSRAEQRIVGTILILASGPFTLLRFAGRDVSILNAIAGLFTPLLWLGLIVYCAGRGAKSALSWQTGLVVLAAALASIGLNDRGNLLSLGIAGISIYFALAERPFTPFRLLFLYLGGNAVGAFSNLMIAARMAVGHEASVPLVLKGLFSTDFLLAMLGLKSNSDPSLIVRDALVRYDQFLIYFQHGRSGLFERVGQLPQMDIVISHLPQTVGIDWGEIRNTLVSALPSIFGQVKQVDFSDRLVWGTRLVGQDTISHPTVTVIGEAYAMGGMPVLFTMLLLLMGGILLWYELSKRVFGDRFVAAATLLAFSIYVMFSSTAISAIGTPLRLYPVALIIYPLVRVAGAILFAGRPGGAAGMRPANA